MSTFPRLLYMNVHPCGNVDKQKEQKCAFIYLRHLCVKKMLEVYPCDCTINLCTRIAKY